MFKQETKDKINGWGSLFRFITPILITLLMFVINDIKDDIKEVRSEQRTVAVELKAYNTNHLVHHAAIEKELAERLASIEATLKFKR